MSMTTQSSVKDKILTTPSETSKVKNALAEMLCDLDQQMEKRADDGKANVVTDALSRVRGRRSCVVKGVALEGHDCFEKKGKLAPRYVEPFKILERIGLVAYRLRLPEELGSVHDTFLVSKLKKCLADANLHVLLDEIKIDKTLHFVEEPVEIMDR
ncbi:hypothetical protein Tco_0481659 [Tanacetum coccineum]